MLKCSSRFPILALAIIGAILGAVNTAQTAVVLPKPTFANSIIISLEEDPASAEELAYIKANLPFGLYAWPSISKTAIVPSLAWVSDWTKADFGIEAFKTSVDTYIAAAKAGGIKFHLVVCSGLARGIGVYVDAKTEDVRNAQWYNDNNIGTAEQVASSGAMTNFVFGTFSRYARKLRANLEAKSRAAFAFLKQRMDENPGTFLVASGWGEAELNNNRIDLSVEIQSWFCDYSPFAVLEFRDWILHIGEYDDTTGKYKGQGWAEGGMKYQGEPGLATFNAEFGQNFKTWDLKYFHWQLTDDWDMVPEDGLNNDPGRLPLSSYVQDGMMPNKESDIHYAHYIAGGFDPPRTINPGGKFWDLWSLFRETMVHNLVLDTAGWAHEAGIPSNRWYSHQIPADYLFGTKPGADHMNSRFYTSASPLWTAGISPFGSTGASIYDVKFADGTVSRTTAWVFPAISAMSDNWAIMEYDAESYASTSSIQSSPEDILAQYLRAYSYRPHLINFYCWTGDIEHRIKGMNKESALRAFIGKIRDKARATDLNVVYDPPQVTGLSGTYGAVAESSAASAAPTGLACAARLRLTGKIWEGEDWNWADWGDFDHFEVYRGPAANFKINKAHLIGTTKTYSYDDATLAYGGVYFYVWRAVNKAGAKGAASAAVMVNATVTAGPLLSLSRTSLVFGKSTSGGSTPAQTVVVTNAGSAGTTIHWTAVSDKPWLSVSPASGTGAGLLSIGVNGMVLAAGKYAGTITVDDPQAANGPLRISVSFKVAAGGKDAAPVGSVTTPVNKANVNSCIPVAGWALDDIAVVKVTVKRFKVPSDAGDVIDADGLVTLGEASLIRGARPDIEKKYAAKYPGADRAGWGYMLMTNLLPGNGNGTFKITAVVTDAAGHAKRLGAKTIFVNNAGANKPFGSIDAPEMGETAFGSAYAQTGWALTPQPDIIPADGSTIQVLMDGVALGNPKYNIYRDDIASLFPGYANSAGAGGSFTLNTTAWANKTHTIAWKVVDSNASAAENTSVIGMRYFDILNIGSSGPGRNAVFLPEVSGGDLSIETPGSMDLQIEELGYVDLVFSVPAGARVFGWGAEADKPLPIGSTLDGNGRFRWLAGPGFLGRHILHFAATDGVSRGAAVEIVVNIVPKSRAFNEGG